MRRFSGANSLRLCGTNPIVEDFYTNEFENTKAFCGHDAQTAEAVAWVKGQGLHIAVASNPVFPIDTMCARIRWAGLVPDDFEIITAYENIGVCKPNPAYYTEIAKRLGLAPEKCLMVGNDVEEDMIAWVKAMLIVGTVVIVLVITVFAALKMTFLPDYITAEVANTVENGDTFQKISRKWQRACGTASTGSASIFGIITGMKRPVTPSILSCQVHSLRSLRTVRILPIDCMTL